MSGERMISRHLSARSVLLYAILGVFTYINQSLAAPEDPEEGGAWGPVVAWPMIPVSAANLPDGRILAWASNERTAFPAGPEFTYTAVWDPDSGQFTEIPHPNHDMFCSHHVMLEDGTVFVSGGRNQGNSPWTSTFNYQTNQWEQLPNMNRGRWYPTSVALPDGKVFTTIGSGGGNTAELWDGSGQWNLLGGLNFDGPILNYTHGERNWWPLLHLAPDGRIFHSGPTPALHFIDTDGIGTITQTNTHSDWYPKHGTSVMYEEGKLLAAGGWVSGDNVASTAQSLVIDLNGPSPQVTTIASMNFPRKFHNGVTLANGEVLIVGGNTSGQKFDDSGTVYPVEIWNPDTQQFRVGAAMAVPRNYHSVALLMTDGRVFSGGGGLCNCAADHQDAQIYSPPYLFNADGSPAARPLITRIAGVVSAGQTVPVSASPGIDRFTLVKMSSTTHAVNSDLRFLSVAFSENGPGEYELNLNPNINVLTPGYWMLFALNAQGTPSVAKVIRVSTQGLETGPPMLKQMQDLSSAQGERINLTLTVSDPDGDALTFSATNLPDGVALNPVSGVLSGAPITPGDYTVTLTVADGSEGSASTTFNWTVYDASNQPGVAYEYYQGTWDLLPDFDALTPLAVGVQDGFSLAPRQQEDFFGFRFSTRLRIDTAGTYTFYTNSDDGSRLYIDGALVVDNDGLHGPLERSGAVALAAGSVDLVVTFFERGGGANLTVSYSGPGIGKQPIPTSVLTVPAAAAELVSGRYVRLVALSEINGNPWASAAEINLLDAAGTPLSRAGWTVSANSEETQGEDGRAVLAVDGNPATIWHTEWSVQAGNDNDPAHPHEFIIDLGASTEIGGLRYLPRQGGSLNGTIGQYAVYATDVAGNWGMPVASGTFAPDALEKSVSFEPAEPPPANQAPTLVNPGSQTDLEGATVQLALQGADADGDPLTYGASGLPAGLTLDAATGVIAGQLAGSGVFAVTVQVSDGSDTATENFDWTVQQQNVAPILTNPAPRTSLAGDSVSLQLSATDPNGDPLTYGATGLPPGLGIEPASGLISGVIGSVGNFTVQVSVTDGALSDTATFAWTVLQQNVAPVVTAPGDQVHQVGTVISLPITAVDANGDAMTFSAAGLPPGLGIAAGTGLITGTTTAAGSYSVTVSASDGALSGAAVFNWQVNAPVEPISVQPLVVTPGETGTPIQFTAVASGSGPLEYSWSFGDDSPGTGYSANASASHQYASAGRYLVTLQVRNTSEEVTVTTTQAIYNPPTATAPAADATILYATGGPGDQVWNVNPDNDSVTVLNPAMFLRLAEIPVGDQPVALASVGADEIWVVNRGDASIHRLSRSQLAPLGTIALPAGSGPYGLVIDPDVGRAYIALERLGEVLELDITTEAELRRFDMGGPVRHLSINHDRTRLYATRFITPPLPGEDTVNPSTQRGGVEIGGELLEMDLPSGMLLRTIALPYSYAGVSEHSGPGLPNYLRGLAIAPDGLSGWIPSKQDNVLAGAARSGFLLDHDHTVRAISSRVDLTDGTADVADRVDHDNASIARAAAFGRYGSYLFVALEGNRMVAVVDAYRGEELFRFLAGRGAAGLVMAPDGRTLFVHNFMDRSVSAHDLSALIEGGVNQQSELAVISTVTSERLAPDVLLGKRHFYDALDGRLTMESYMACASCHSDGDDDGRIWDFTQFGEGLRNTISLVGHGEQGRAHWTGNFDEIQDFEGQIRSFAGGLGLMADAQFNAGTRSEPLGDPKAGLSADLDALAAYVNSLTEVPASPYRTGGDLSAAAQSGLALFEANGCGNCHAGTELTDSDQALLHDIGSLKAHSGQRLGAPLTGLDTPTLLGLLDTPPYLHDGSAATLEAAILAHTGLGLNAADAADLAAFLREMTPADLVQAFDPASMNPLHYWSADNTTASSAGATNDLVLSGGVGFAPGKQGQALQFDGVDDTLLSAAPVSLTGNAPWSVAFWFNPGPNPQVSGYGGVLFGFGSAGSTTAPFVTYNGTRSRFEYGFWGSSGATAGNYPPGIWRHLVAVYDGDRFKLFVDGDEILNRDIANLNIPASPLGLGWDSVSNVMTWNYDGLLDEIYLFDRALTPAEIQTLAVGEETEVNAPPVVTSPGDQLNLDGDAVSLFIQASDPDGDTLTFSATGLPGGLSVDAVTGEVSGTAGAGDYAVTVSVADPAGASANVSFNWVVNEPAAPDADGDGVPDAQDAFPNDPSEWTDTDGDGVGDNADVFPNDPAETADSDGDGVGDNADQFPADPNESQDSDGDGVGDNADAYPGDPTRWEAELPAARFYWPLDGDLNTAEGQANELTGAGGVQFAPGKLGQAVSLDGVDDTLLSTGLFGVTGSGAWSVSLWFNPGANTQVSGYGRVLFGWGRGGSNTAPFVTYNGTRSRFEYGFWNSGGASAQQYPTGQWYHLVATYDGATFRLYVDGVEILSRNVTLNVPDSALGIGWDSVSNVMTWNFDGLIDEIYVFDTAVDQAVVTGLRNQAQ